MFIYFDSVFPLSRPPRTTPRIAQCYEGIGTARISSYYFTFIFFILYLYFILNIIIIINIIFIININILI